jgi:hypothetical protein
LKQLIEAKQHGKSIEVESAPKRAPVIDMMAALKKSLAATTSAGLGTNHRHETNERRLAATALSSPEKTEKRETKGTGVKSRRAAPARKAS